MDASTCLVVDYSDPLTFKNERSGPDVKVRPRITLVIPEAAIICSETIQFRGSLDGVLEHRWIVHQIIIGSRVMSSEPYSMSPSLQHVRVYAVALTVLKMDRVMLVHRRILETAPFVRHFIRRRLSTRSWPNFVQRRSVKTL